MMASDIDEYLGQRAAEGWAAQTIHAYRKRLTWAAEFFRKRGRRRVTDVVPEDIDAWIIALMAQGAKAGTRSAYTASVRTFFRWLAEHGRILSNPARGICLPEDQDQPLPTPPLEEHEIAALFDSLPRRSVVDLRNHLHLELLYSCGLRLGESVALDVTDIDLGNRIVRVRPGKTGRGRVLPLLRGVLGALRDYLALRRSLLKGPDDGALLLALWSGKRLDEKTFRLWLWKLNKKRGNKRRLHPHLLRHSIAVHLLRGGADIRHVQEFLGHADIDTTKIYLRLVPGRLKEDYDKAIPEIAVRA